MTLRRPRLRDLCGAYARSTGQPCKAHALPSGRCKLHGGASTGPRTPEGKLRVLAGLRQYKGASREALQRIVDVREAERARLRQWIAEAGATDDRLALEVLRTPVDEARAAVQTEALASGGHRRTRQAEIGRLRLKVWEREVAFMLGDT